MERWRKLTPRILLDHTTGFQNFRFINPDGKLDFKFDPRHALRLFGAKESTCSNSCSKPASGSMSARNANAACSTALA